jgi:hypothetical protein
MSENGIIAPNMEHAYWGVKCKNPECQHYILREDLSLQPEGIVGRPPEPYPNFDQACEHCGQIHMYARNDVQVVQGPAPAAAAETQLRAAHAHERQLKASHETNDDDRDSERR